MEPEEMKRTWDTLTRRLEKQEIVSRRLLTESSNAAATAC